MSNYSLIAVRVPTELKLALEDIAKVNDVSVSGLIRQLIKQHLATVPAKE